MNIGHPNDQVRRSNQHQSARSEPNGTLQQHINGINGNQSLAQSRLVTNGRQVSQETQGNQNLSRDIHPSNDCDNYREQERVLNARLLEQYNRYNLMQNIAQSSNSRHARSSAQQNHNNNNINNNNNNNNNINNNPTNASILTQLDNLKTINDRLDGRYGRMADFGWLALGNIGKMIGVTLTSIVQAPAEIESKCKVQQTRKKDRPEEDLIVLDADDEQDEDERTNNHHVQTDSATSKIYLPTWTRPMSDYDRLRPDRTSSRTNYNLRGHLDEIIIVKWNELYQKLATVDSRGNVLIWCKVNQKFSIQTPFYNRTKTVADFKWSNDGKTALICYTDSFILVGSSSGQRHWHSMLNLEDYHITCASWTPNDEQLLFGVSNGNIVAIDLPRSELIEFVVCPQVNIRSMCWSSSCGLDLRNLMGPQNNELGQEQSDGSDDLSRRKSIVVNHKRFSRDCSVFSRYRFCSQGPTLNGVSNSNDDPASTRTPTRPLLTERVAFNSSCPPASTNPKTGPVPKTIPPRLSAIITQPKRPPLHDGGTSIQDNILAIDFADNTIGLYLGGLSTDDYKQLKQIQVGLESYVMSWSTDGRLLAVAGFNIFTSAPIIGCLRCRYVNMIKFYNRRGKLIYEYKMNYSRHPITAFTWAHDNKRIFVATGPRLHCAKVLFDLPSLAFLTLSCLQRHTKMADKVDVLENLLLRNQFSYNVLNWQSFNCPLQIAKNSANSRLVGEDQPGLMSSASEVCDSITSAVGGSAVGGSANSSSPHSALMRYSSNVNVSRLNMHPKLSNTLNDLFSLTIKPPYEEQYSLNDIAWHVPKNNQRYYCTLICYTSEPLDGVCGALGQQYKTNTLDMGSHCGSSSSTTTVSGASDQYKIFVLYCEFQGSLIPILKARRIGFLKPEFVIFDPELDSPNGNLLHQRQQQKVSDVSASSAEQPRTPSRAAYANQMPAFMSQCTSQLEAYCQLESNCTGLHDHSLSSPFSRENINQADKLDRRKLARRKYLLDRHTETLRSLDGGYIKSPTAQSTKSALDRNKSRARCGTRKTPTCSALPEMSELVRIRSNVWGTKFKLTNVCNQTLRQRRVRLGSVEYKASILHLQPRQICLSMKDMSNYCCLCSTHHHSIAEKQDPKRLVGKVSTESGLSRIPRSKQRAKSNDARRSDRSISQPRPVERPSLIDLSLPEFGDDLVVPPPLPPRRSVQSLARPNIRTSLDDNKILLSVGDSIKIAPKPETNQKYKLQLKSSPQKATTSQGSSSLSLLSHRRAQDLVGANKSDQSPRTSKRTPFGEPAKCAKTNDDDDILTLSVNQSHQVQVDMLIAKKKDEPSYERPTSSRGHEKHMDEFLGANKTLKSIQTITKMIVDLSARASDDCDDDLRSSNTSSPRARAAADSPKKLLKTKRHADVTPIHPTKQLVPPQTPVHKPKFLRAPSGTSSRNCHDQLTTQSATTTPLRDAESLRRKRRVSHRSSRAGEEKIDRLISLELPPPPPSVPFGRRISSSAKRLFDGSLRSLANTNNGYSTAHETGDESEDCEPLVAAGVDHHARRLCTQQPVKKNNNNNNKFSLALNWPSLSQPASPVRVMRSRSDIGQLKQSMMTPQSRQLDLTNLRGQLLQKLRDSTRSWRSTSGAGLDRMADNKRTPRAARPHLSLLAKNLQDNDSSAASSSDSSSDLCLDSELDESLMNECGPQAHTGRARSRMRWSSARNLDRYTDECDKSFGAGMEPASRQQLKKKRQRRRHSAAAKQSICDDSKCCCANEFKLNNRPPVWNEQSQVYQLDFSGRVTQESAKNLQIDFEGNLALQFGRIDRCTYTLDYKYPFNAMQAMSVALASLTQRLK